MDIEGLLAIIIVGYFLVLPFVLLVKVIRLHRRINEIEKFLEIRPVKHKTIGQVKGIPEKTEPKTVSAEKPAISWETELGRKYFYWIGIFIFLVGVALFLKHTFENRWFNEVVKVIIGIVSGALFTFAGSRIIARYRQFSLGLFGIGTVIFYLSFYTANNFYHIIPYITALIMMTLVTCLCVVLTLAHDSIFLAFIALIGGFLTPFILQNPVEIPHLTAFFGLASYLFLLNAGFIAVNILKPWRILSVCAAFFTYLILYLWVQEFYTAQFFAAAISCISVFFLVYLVFILSRFSVAFSSKSLDIVLIVANTAAYSGFVFYLVNSISPDFKGMAAIAIALIHTLAAFIYGKTSHRDENVTLLLLGTALVFLTIVFPLYLKNTYITIAWVCEGLLIFWLGLRIPSEFMRIFGYMIFLLTICRFLAFDTELQWVRYTTFLNERFLTGICVVVCLFLSSALSLKRMNVLKEQEKRFPALLAGIAHVFMFIILTIEIQDACRGSTSRFVEQIFLSISWALYGGMLLAAGMIFRVKMVRYFALAYLALAVLKVIFFDLFSTGKIYRAVISIVVGAILILVGFVYHRKKDL